MEKRSWADRIAGFVVMAAAIAGMMLLICLAGRAAELSFQGRVGEAAGLANYEYLFSNSRLVTAVGNSLTEMCLLGTLGLLLSVLIACELQLVWTWARHAAIAALCLPMVWPGLGNTVSVMLDSQLILWLVKLWYCLGPGVLIISAAFCAVNRRARYGSHRIQRWHSFVRTVLLPGGRGAIMLAAVAVLSSLAVADVRLFESVGAAGRRSWNETMWVAVQRLITSHPGYAFAAATLALLMTALWAAVLCLLIRLLTRPPRRNRWEPDDVDQGRTRIRGYVFAALCVSLTLGVLMQEVKLSLMEAGESLHTFWTQSHTLQNYEAVLADWPFSIGGDWWLFILLPVAAALMLLLRNTAEKWRIGMSNALALPLLLTLLLWPLCMLYKKIELSQSAAAFNLLLFLLPALCLMLMGGARNFDPDLGYGSGWKGLVKMGLLWFVAMPAAMVLPLTWNDVIGRQLANLQAYRVSTAGMVAAAGVFADLLPVLLIYPATAGATRLLAGLGDIRPCHLEENE